MLVRLSAFDTMLVRFSAFDTMLVRFSAFDTMLGGKYPQKTDTSSWFSPKGRVRLF